MSNTYPKLFPLYKFGAQLFELYQMTGDDVGEKLPSKPTFKILQRLSQQDDIFGEAIGTLVRNLMISPTFLAHHIQIPSAMGPYISRTTPESAATFLSPHQKGPFTQTSSLRLIHWNCEKSATATGAESFGFVASAEGRRARNNVLTT